jgi:hypothetical protein
MGGPITTAIKQRERNSWLQRYLGQWYPILYENESTLWMPVLETEKFLDYMKKINEIFKPVGNNFAHAPWAHLLHALGITPDTSHILEKQKVLLIASTCEENYQLPMQVDGEVLCHNVNLFWKQYGHLPVLRKPWDPDISGDCSPIFGTFAWIITEDGPRVSLNPGIDRSGLGYLPCPLLDNLGFGSIAFSTI